MTAFSEENAGIADRYGRDLGPVLAHIADWFGDIAKNLGKPTGFLRHTLNSSPAGTAALAPHVPELRRQLALARESVRLLPIRLQALADVIDQIEADSAKDQK